MMASSFINSLPASVMKFDLGRMQKVVEALGNPQNVYPSIHIAGTNGKGSVAAMIASVLKEAGLHVGLYTSPHLIRVNERFQINGTQISNAELNKLSHQLIKKFPHLTQFEFLTAIAFQWFAQKKIDVAVIETGLGGRLDATNVLSRVLVSVITTIDFDHTEWLGNTIRKIAAEKGGIIKSGVPVVTGVKGEALAVLRSIANRKNAPLIQVKESRRHYELALQGRHQQKNAAVAVRVLEALKETPPDPPTVRRGEEFLSPKIIRRGLRNARWPGRFEQFLVGSRRVILDGAHNPAGCRALVQTLKEKKMTSVNLLFGALKDKDISHMTKILEPVVKNVITVPVDSNRTARAEDLAKESGWKGKASPAASVNAGWKKIRLLPNKGPILVAGSLYLVGDIRRRVI